MHFWHITLDISNIFPTHGLGHFRHISYTYSLGQGCPQVQVNPGDSWLWLPQVVVTQHLKSCWVQIWPPVVGRWLMWLWHIDLDISDPLAWSSGHIGLDVHDTCFSAWCHNVCQGTLPCLPQGACKWKCYIFYLHAIFHYYALQYCLEFCQWHNIIDFKNTPANYLCYSSGV